MCRIDGARDRGNRRESCSPMKHLVRIALDTDGGAQDTLNRQFFDSGDFYVNVCNGNYSSSICIKVQVSVAISRSAAIVDSSGHSDIHVNGSSLTTCGQ